MVKKRVFQAILSFTENCVAMREAPLFHYGDLEAMRLAITDQILASQNRIMEAIMLGDIQPIQVGG